MARDGSITLGWADGEYRFRLAWAQLRALQEACDAGPGHVLERLQTNRWRIEDIEQVLFQGLLGGGMEAAQVRRLIRAYVQEQPLGENVMIAQAVLAAAVVGAPDDDEAQMPSGKPMPADRPPLNGAN